MSHKRHLVTLLVLLLVTIPAVRAVAGAALFKHKIYMPSVWKTAGTTPQNHFDDCAFDTDSNATVAVPAGVQINGHLNLAVGDEIAIFSSNGSLCAGVEIWNGESIAIATWGDDSRTNKVDGLQDGEKIRFRIWDKSKSKELEVKSAAYSRGDGFYTTDGIYAVKSFTLK